MNVSFLVGRLGKDAELKQVGQTTVCNFSIATTERFKNKDGEKQEKVDWHKVAAWGKLGESLAQYLKKGTQVAVFGRNETHEWESKTGEKHYTTGIVADKIELLGDGKRREENTGTGVAASAPRTDDDIPF